mmetsp:Transcript_77674/g.128745  ORF Transcript_77674/g.128745 Transcript_77674/m.128745 type:complete len:342 (+) Transcript_77674:79-1104(+)
MDAECDIVEQNGSGWTSWVPFPSFPTKLAKVLGVSFAGLFVGNTLVLLAAAGVLLMFWLVRAVYVPGEMYRYPVFLQYMPKSLPPPGADGHVYNSSAACASTLLPSLPRGRFEADFQLELTAPTFDDSRLQQPVMCSIELLTDEGVQVASSSRPLLLPTHHWLVNFWSAMFWGPFIALGLVRDERLNVEVPLLENLRLPRALFNEIASARVCLQPPMPAFRTEIVAHLEMLGPLRLVQKRPLLCSLIIVVCTSAVGWVVIGCFCVFVFAVQLYFWSSRETAGVSEKRGGVTDKLWDMARERDLLEESDERSSRVKSSVMKGVSQNPGSRQRRRSPDLYRRY